jgi:hypothetical protein
MSESEAQRAERERMNRAREERAEELKRVPLQTVDKSKWPNDVRPIAMSETGGLGVDRDGRLHWDGRPVEIVGRRLDLTTMQTVVGIAVAGLTLVIALATVVQAAVAYHDWACKTGWPTLCVSCPPVRHGPP